MTIDTVSGEAMPVPASYVPAWSLAVLEGEPKALFVGRESGVVEKCDVNRIDASKPLMTLVGHTACVTGICVASNEELYTVSIDGTMRTWNIAAEVEGKREGGCLTLGGSGRCIAAIGDAVYVGLSSGVIIKIDHGKIVAQLEGHTDATVALAASDISLFSASYDGTLRAWDLTTGAAQFVFEGHHHHVKGLAVVNGTSLLSVGRDETLMVWNIPSADALAPDPAVAEASPSGDADAASTPVPPQSAPTAISVQPAGALFLPSVPSTAAMVGNTLTFGCSDGSLRGIGTKALIKAVTDYHANLERLINSAIRSIDKNAFIKTRNAKRLMKRAIRDYKAQLMAEASADRGAAQVPSTGGDAEDAPAGDEQAEEGNIPLGAEREERLARFTEEATIRCDTAVSDAQSAKHAQIQALGPLRTQRYSLPKEKYLATAFCFTFNGARKEPVLHIASDTANGILACVGSEVLHLPCRIGVHPV